MLCILPHIPVPLNRPYAADVNECAQFLYLYSTQTDRPCACIMLGGIHLTEKHFPLVDKYKTAQTKGFEHNDRTCWSAALLLNVFKGGGWWRGFSYRDIIVCAVSKGDLSKEIICAVVSPTWVRDARADVWMSGGAGGGPGSSRYKRGRLVARSGAL